MFTTNTEQWAEATFSQANLGDRRRTKRLVSLVSSLANHVGQSLVQSLKSPADIEAAYRFTRNSNIQAESIAEAGYSATTELAKVYQCLLAIEDSTSLSFTHQTVRDEMGYTNRPNARGMQAHSILLFAPSEQHLVGLIEQSRWTRNIDEYGKKNQRARRPYKEKESYKWESSSIAMAGRLGSQMDKVISVCDREADIIDYLSYKTVNRQRFVVRSAHSRCLEGNSEKLYQLASALTPAGVRLVDVKQKGGRKQRQATCDVSYAKVTLKISSKKKGQPIALYYVCCRERNHDKGLCWHLLTSEQVESHEDAQQILDYYEKRWLIEEFHKAWKSGGAQVEKLRMQCKDNLEKMVVILAFVAIRLHQLRYLGLNQPAAEQESCETILSPLAWKLLWSKQEKSKLPKEPPTVYWAYINLGKLAGWYDSKRNGRVGWERLWQGWFKLQTILEGYELAQSLKR